VIYYGAACHIDKEIEARYFVDTLSVKKPKNIIRSSFILLTMPPEENQTKGYDRVFQKSGRYRWNDGANGVVLEVVLKMC
jgi:hypothetical protein